MINQFSSEQGFVIAGAATGQIFASQVGGIGLVGSFGGIALGTPVIVVSGAIASEKSPIILKNQKREFYGTIVARDPGDDFSGSSCYCLN